MNVSQSRSIRLSSSEIAGPRIVCQWRNAFRRHSSMNSGSSFLLEISRMIPSLAQRYASAEKLSVLAVGEAISFPCNTDF